MILRKRWSKGFFDWRRGVKKGYCEREGVKEGG
jgi:hypothetical protein